MALITAHSHQSRVLLPTRWAGVIAIAHSRQNEFVLKILGNWRQVGWARVLYIHRRQRVALERPRNRHCSRPFLDLLPKSLQIQCANSFPRQAHTMEKPVHVLCVTELPEEIQPSNTSWQINTAGSRGTATW